MDLIERDQWTVADDTAQCDPFRMVWGSDLGALARNPEALNWEGRRWVTLFTGSYHLARDIMPMLDEHGIENRLGFPEKRETDDAVIVEVRQLAFREAKGLMDAMPEPTA